MDAVRFHMNSNGAEVMNADGKWTPLFGEKFANIIAGMKKGLLVGPLRVFKRQRHRPFQHKNQRQAA